MDNSENNVKAQYLMDLKYRIEKHIKSTRRSIDNSKFSKDFPNSYLKVAGMKLERAEVLVGELENFYKTLGV
jgi:hypothetical protein